VILIGCMAIFAIQILGTNITEEKQGTQENVKPFSVKWIMGKLIGVSVSMTIFIVNELLGL
jgi:hypothetical protein